MEETSAAEILGLKETLTQVVVRELSKGSFEGIARAAYLDESRKEELKAVIDDWPSVATSLGTPKSESNVLAGYLQFITGNLKEAENLLKPEKSTPWGACHYGRVLVKLRKLVEAAKVVGDAYKKHTDFLPLSYLHAEILCLTDREEEGSSLLEELKKVDGESTEWAYTNAFCLERSGDYRGAIENYRLAVERQDSNVEAWFRLGYLVDLYGTREEEESDEAVRAYEACLEAIPFHTNAVINLGLIYEDRERYHDAVKCYETVLKAYPNHARAKLYLGDAVAATSMFYDREQEKKADRHSQVLKIPVTDFELSVRSRNCLQKMNIDTLGDLIMKTEQELLSYKNFGETSLKEIKDMLTQRGLRLGQGLEDQGTEPPAGRNPLEATVSSEVLSGAIEELNLSVRSRRCMERLEVRTVRDLINKTEVDLMSAKNFGMTSLNEIKKKLVEFGLGLRS